MLKILVQEAYEGKSINDIAIEEPGYPITYLSYESSAPDRVFFDDFSITLETSTVIQQEDYSPFGLSFASYAAGDDNVYKYNGVEQDPSTKNYEMMFRGYDPSLGRFMQVDPLTHIIPGVSSYHFGYNNPVNFNDPLGLISNSQIPYRGSRNGDTDLFGRKKYDTWGNYIPPQDREGGANCQGCYAPDETDNLAMVDEEGHAIYESDIAGSYRLKEFGTKGQYYDQAGNLVESSGRVQGYYLIPTDQNGGSGFDITDFYTDEYKQLHSDYLASGYDGDFNSYLSSVNHPGSVMGSNGATLPKVTKAQLDQYATSSGWTGDFYNFVKPESKAQNALYGFVAGAAIGGGTVIGVHMAGNAIGDKYYWHRVIGGAAVGGLYGMYVGWTTFEK